MKVIPAKHERWLILWNEDDLRWHRSLTHSEAPSTDLTSALRTQAHDEPVLDFSDDDVTMYAPMGDGLFMDAKGETVDASFGVLVDNSDPRENARRKWAAWRSR